MSFTIEDIARVLNGTIEGPVPAVAIERLARIEDATEGSITFLGNMKYLSFIYTTQASVVVVEHGFTPTASIKPALLRVENAYNAFMTLTGLFKQKNEKTGISAQAAIHPTARLGSDIYIGDFASIGPHAVIGNHVKIFAQVYVGDNVSIGDNTILYPGVKIYSDCVIGNNCKIHAGTIIGADGFGFAPQQDNTYNKIEQIGNVVLEDQVEIGANTTIDRAAIGSTIIRKGVKLDNLIQIAHNVEIGENTVIAAQTGVSGSTKIGRNCMIGGQVGIVGHLTIGDNVKIAAQSGIGSNLKDGAMVQGSPAFEIGDYRKAYVCFKKLPQYFNLFYKIEKD